MPVRLQVGEAQITLITVGHLLADMVDWLRLQPTAWKPRYSAVFERPFLVPIQCVHVRLGATAVLIDAPGHEEPPAGFGSADTVPLSLDLLSQLWSAGLPPESIEHVVITHSHIDHYGGVTAREGKSYALAFPNAVHYLSRADWEQPGLQRAIRRRNSEDSRTLGVLESRKRLELVDGRREIAPGITILPAPGETPGHQIVRIHSAGETLYCLGDLFHHTVEVEQPEWMPHWCNRETTIASRKALIETASADSALLIATHIPGAGRLAVTEEGARWVDVND